MFRSLSDEELLRKLDTVRSRSPVIEELCQRLELVVLGVKIARTSDFEVSCPACQARLEVCYEESNHFFSIDFKDTTLVG